MASNDPAVERDNAIDVARTALADFNDSGDPSAFERWRKASELAVKWTRACRLEGTADEPDELAQILEDQSHLGG